MRILLTAVCGYVLDLLLGDPPTLTRAHPVVWMGHAIRALERLLRRCLPMPHFLPQLPLRQSPLPLLPFLRQRPVLR